MAPFIVVAGLAGFARVNTESRPGQLGRFVGRALWMPEAAVDRVFSQFPDYTSWPSVVRETIYLGGVIYVAGLIAPRRPSVVPPDNDL